MKAYQVFNGDIDKHDRPYYELLATYFDKDRALHHCRRLAEEEAQRGELVEEHPTKDGKSIGWYAVGWESVGVVKFSEIEIIE
jgi:hypothetical protein